MGSDKPGWQTTEFWISILGVLLSVLLATGYLSAGDVAKVQAPAADAINHVFALCSIAVIVYRYIAQRHTMKMAAGKFMVRRMPPPMEYGTPCKCPIPEGMPASMDKPPKDEPDCCGK